MFMVGLKRNWYKRVDKNLIHINYSFTILNGQSKFSDKANKDMSMPQRRLQPYHLIYGCILFFLIGNVTANENKKYAIYIDADFSIANASSQSIQQGITTALAEVNFQVQGINFEIIAKNHRANSSRSRKNLQSYLADDQALIVFSGLHSPPLLANKSFINNSKILLLDPWAAAGPITRSTDKENWIFRLSIDDSNAGTFISKQALKQGFKKPYLLLEDTGWGRSNEKTMTLALKESSIEPAGVVWFNWGVGKNHAKVILRNIKESGADVLFFVGNSPEGVTFAHAMSELPSDIRIPIRSHWGITGGSFTTKVLPKTRSLLDLQFIQTNFSFLNEPLSTLSQQVLTLAIKANEGINDKNDILATAGFIHSYDLTKIVIAAMNQIKLTGNKKEDLLSIHHALENLENPVQGLLKTYQQPFSAFSRTKLNAHEALGVDNYVMGYFNDENQTVLIQNQ